ncbi:hypothetical protein JCM1840_006379 [Sporobolomyces johnsonii]
MLSRARVLVQTAPRPRAVVPSCSACRAFSSSPAPSAPRNSSDADRPAPPASASSGATDRLLDMIEDVVSQPSPSAVEGRDQISVLQHLKRNQVISPQHLAPQHLLTPYLPRPNFSLAFPLGPPTAYGPTHDPFVRYGLDPLKDSPLNPFWKAEFTTTMGKIKSRGKTGLQRKSQRRVAKAIRRARSMGIIPTFGVSVPGQGGERY